MRYRKLYPVRLIAVVALIVSGRLAAAADTVSSPVTVSAVTGAAAVRVSGNVAGTPQLEAVSFAVLAPELPIVRLSRTPLTQDAGGHFEATIPIAPAYFVGAIITVNVQTTAGVLVGSGSITITDAGVSAPVHS